MAIHDERNLAFAKVITSPALEKFSTAIRALPPEKQKAEMVRCIVRGLVPLLGAAEEGGETPPHLPAQR